MRLAGLAWSFLVAALVIYPVTEGGAAVLAVLGLGLLPVIGYRNGSWAGLRWALIVPAAAVAADVVTFTPLSLQPESDATIYTPILVWYLPLWLLLVGAGIGGRRHTHGAAGRTAP